jgi:quercetin dioxygenase-like cupin family protein
MGIPTESPQQPHPPVDGASASTDATVNTDPTVKTVGSPRPTFDGPAAIPYADVTRYLWGDDGSGEVADWIYASTDKLHMLVYALPPGGKCLHSNAHRTVFGADVTYFVLQGRLVLANPEVGEIRVVEPGEAVLFRRDTWHHIFSDSLTQLRVLEFFAPPPSTGTSRKYAQTLPLLEESRYADDSLLGAWSGALPAPTLHHRREGDFLWRRDGDALVGIIVSTEHLTVATLSLLPGKRSAPECHGGDECLYVLEGVLNVRTSHEGSLEWLELHAGDGFYCPQGTEHEYHNISDGIVKAVFGVAPAWRP